MPGAAPPRKPLLATAIAILARRDHSRAELERKLLAKLEPGEDRCRVDATLQQLQQRGLLSDARVAQEFVRVRAARFGRSRLRYELQRRGIDAETVAQAVPSSPEGELQAARAIWQKRYGTVARSPAERARQARFLLARGFPGEVISRVIAGLDEGDES